MNISKRLVDLARKIDIHVVGVNLCTTLKGLIKSSPVVFILSYLISKPRKWWLTFFILSQMRGVKTAH